MHLVLWRLKNFSHSGVNTEKIEERVRQRFGFSNSEVEVGLVEVKREGPIRSFSCSRRSKERLTTPKLEQ